MQQNNPFAEAPALLASGYSPLPLNGKRPVLTAWQKHAVAPMTPAEIEYWGQRGTINVGVALSFNDVIAIDRDTEDAAIIRAVRDVFRAIYRRGGVPVGKKGKRGATSFFRDPTGTIRNRNIADRDGEMLFEILAAGRQTAVPPSIHPDTGSPYLWTTARTLLDTRPDELAEIAIADVEAIEDALRLWTDKAERHVSKTMARPLRLTHLDADEIARQRGYAQAILDREAGILAAMRPESGRNKRAFNVACRLGRWVHHDVISEAAIEVAIIDACQANGLVKEDGAGAVLRTVASGLKRSEKDHLPDLGARSGRVAA